MQYRSFSKIPDCRVSLLGFGCMRLPLIDGDPAHIREDEATQLLHHAIESGVNYIDTAWPYHKGESEPFVGRALRQGWRDRVFLATKHPVMLVEAEHDWERYLDQQLKRLETNAIDFYLLHALGRERWKLVQRLNGLRAMERARADGRIRHLGFSFHGALDDFKEIVDGYDWEFCQIQLNYLDTSFQAGLEGLRYAASKRIGVVVMEPLRGGALANPPSAIRQILASSGHPWSPAEWALRWVFSHGDVVTALSGMGTIEQLRENLAVANQESILGAPDRARVEEAAHAFRTALRVPCTACGYCQPCPSRVAISDVLSLYNGIGLFERPDPPFVYRNFFQKNGSGADRCIACGACEARCPQNLAIVEHLRAAHQRLTSD